MARPKSYDRDQVLTSAMFKFWHKGYEATGIRDIEEVTGLPASSLYHNFGNKEAIFLLVIDFYNERVIRPRIRQYLNQENPLAGIQQFFCSCFTDLPKDTSGIACLIVNTMAELGAKNETIRAKLEQGEKDIKKEFKQAVERSKSAGLISENLDTNSLVDQLILTLNGLLLSSKIVRNEARMVKASKQALCFLLGAEIV